MSTYMVTEKRKLSAGDGEGLIDYEYVIGTYEQDGKLGAQKAAEAAFNDLEIAVGEEDLAVEVSVYRIELARRYRGQLTFAVERIDGEEDEKDDD